MIPALLKTPANSERTSDLYAYISTENINKSEKPKSLCGQLRKCNLTKSSLVGGIILKEVCIDSLGTLECSLDWSIDFKLNGKKIFSWFICSALDYHCIMLHFLMLFVSFSTDI